LISPGLRLASDAYDLFVIGIAPTLITKQWHLSSGKLAPRTPAPGLRSQRWQPRSSRHQQGRIGNALLV
jgi:hypothetical protein